jgi:MOSC domain-containing protein YiiM
MEASVLSVNLAEPRTIRWRGQDVWTGIFKEPVAGPVRAAGVSLEGDHQVDKRVHGGDAKAVYAYACEDYEWWEQELGRELPPGTFGENLTLGGVRVSGAPAGERWRVGSALLEVTDPRLPCFKLGVKMGDNRFLKRFTAAGRPGTYLRIVEEGELAAGDAVEVVSPR